MSMTIETTQDAQDRLVVWERVMTGAEWLDAIYPDWIEEVDLTSLAMESGCRCVLGQVFYDTAAHLRYVGQRPEHHVWSGYAVVQDMAVRSLGAEAAYEWLGEHGFDIVGDVGGDEEFALLDEAWAEYLTERKAR